MRAILKPNMPGRPVLRLQSLLAEHPEILAGGDHAGERGGWVLVRREAGVADAELRSVHQAIKISGHQR